MLVVPGAPSGPTLTILGSGTLAPDDRRHGAAHFVEARGLRLLMDCGPGTVHGMDRYGVAWAELTHVAITHYHNDHVGDLPALLQALKYGIRPRRTRPLTLLGPRGLGEWLGRMGDLMGSHVTSPGFPLEVVELGPGEEYGDRSSEARISCMPTPHTPESVAYRVDTGRACVGYTGDTGPSDLVARFLAGCDALVCECNHADPPPTDTHLSPTRVAELAATARPALLVVTHVAPPGTPEGAAALVSSLWNGKVVAGRDGLAIPLE